MTIEIDGFDAVMKLLEADSATISANAVGLPSAAKARLIANGTTTIVAPTWLITSENAVVRTPTSNSSTHTGVLKMDEAYAAISWKTVFLMACLIPLGWAMDSSGAAAWVAGHSIERLPQGLPAWSIELVLGLLTTAFSLVISHVGATIVMVPLAINLALAVGGNPTAFALIVALSASNNFITASNPSISMVTGPAGYTPRDMWRVGGPLTLMYTAIIVGMVNVLF